MMSVEKQVSPCSVAQPRMSNAQPETRVFSSDSPLMSLLWDSIQHSKLDNLTASTDSEDSPLYGEDSSPEFSFDFEMSVIEARVFQPLDPRSSPKLSKTARERKAAKERKLAKLVKYEKNSKLIRTRQNKNGERLLWNHLKKKAEPESPVLGLNDELWEESFFYNSIKPLDLYMLPENDTRYRFASEGMILDEF